MTEASRAANRRYYAKNRERLRAADRARYRAKLGDKTKGELKRERQSIVAESASQCMAPTRPTSVG